MTQILEKAADAMSGAPKTHQLFIAGEWVDSVSGQTFESTNPADRRDVIGQFQAGTAADVAMAVKAAEMALPRWKATPAPEARRDPVPLRRADGASTRNGSRAR